MQQEIIDRMNSIKWTHKIELEPGLFTPGKMHDGPPGYIDYKFGIPASLQGKTVLDIGAWDGLFSFEAEKRKADRVVAIDIFLNKNVASNNAFEFAREFLKSKVEFFPYSIYEDIKQKLGVFDITFFFGVLYHLDNPLLGMQNLANCTKEYSIIETAILFPEANNENFPLVGYYPKYYNDPYNYFYPNVKALVAMCESAGFKSTELIHNDGWRCTIKANK